MDFVLFLLVNATLFIRPGEISADLARLPIFNVLICSNLALAVLPIARRLAPASLRREPITAAVLGLIAAVALSHLCHLQLALAAEATVGFMRVVLYYLLGTAVLRTAARLRWFLTFLTIYVLALAVLALLHYHGLVNIPALAAVADGEVDPVTGESYVVMRLCSTGIFNDPNDLSLILVLGIGCAAYLSGLLSRMIIKPQWLACMGVFAYALTLTYSRGGFLALVAATMVLFYTRFGVGRSVALGALVLPAMLVLFGGRQTNISMGEDTGQERIQLWSQGLVEMRGSPLFGIGDGLYAERVGLVAHNSYIQAFVELGLFGGILFFGAIAYAIWSLHRLGAAPAGGDGDPLDLARLRLFLLASVVGYCCGMLTVSRNESMPTYMVLAIVNSYLRLVVDASPDRGPAARGAVRPLSPRLVLAVVLAALGFLVLAKVFIMIMVRH